MTSYADTPSGFFIEYGWKGRMIDPEAWQSHEMFDGSSLLGDDQHYMPSCNASGSAAARGVRVPDPSVPPLNCPWLEAVIAQDSACCGHMRPNCS
jgi:hypothetical protein